MDSAPKPSRDRFDVAVAGAGPAGIGAALGAAANGATVVLLEKHPVPGGMGTAALVNNFCNAHFDGERFIIGGVFAAIRERLIGRGALHVTGGLEPYDEEIFIEEALALLRQAGVECRFGAPIESAAFGEPGEPAALWAGGVGIAASTVVDASGDAHLAAAAGVAFTLGERSPVMPLTYCYLVGPVDLERLREKIPGAFLTDRRTGQSFVYLGSQPVLIDAVREARKKGTLTIPRERIAVAYGIPGKPEIVAVNFGRVTVNDPTDPAEMAAATAEGLRQVDEGVAFFREYVPGFENAKAVRVARQIGVRESRQIKGRYCLTGEDVLGGRQFDDVIAQSCYSIDIHLPHSDRTTLRSLPPGSHYDIPLRCLIPARGPGNLIVAGRSISATQAAMSSFRVSPSVMAIGEAAGVTAALAARWGLPIAEVPSREVQKALLNAGAILT